MNQTFSFPRFARLHRWLWATKGRTYLIGLGTLVIVGCLGLSSRMSSDYTTYDVFSYQGHLSFFILSSVVLVTGLGSDVFSALFRQESAISYLMIPASRTEKFWLGVGYCLVFLLAFTSFYFGYDAFVYSVANGHLKADQPRYTSTLHYYLSEGSVIQVTFYTLLLLLVTTLLGSLYFRRGVVARNIGLILGTLIGFFLLYQAITGLQFRGMDVGVTSPFPFTDMVVHKDGTAQNLEVPNWITYTVYGLLFVGLWLTARVRFNEIER